MKNCFNEGVSGRGLVEISPCLALEVEDKASSARFMEVQPEERCANAPVFRRDSRLAGPGCWRFPDTYPAQSE